MKKVAIFTLCGNNNFGNKLQNYALLKSIEKLDCNVNTIWIEKPSNYSTCKRIMAIIRSRVKNLKKRKRTYFFKKFNKQFLNMDYSICLTNNLKKINKKYDYAVFGSDQIWNCTYIPDISIYFGKNIDKEKCFSYAASFGIYDIESEKHEIYKNGLQHLKYISIREEHGKELVEKLSGRKDSEILLDPTMMLTRDEWIEIEQKTNINIPSKYILTYYLGRMDESKKKEIERVAKENGCEIINLMDEKSEFYNIGPCEFIYLIHNSFLVCTDSFHACVFSIIFDKSFIIFDRDYKGKNMNSRIDTLLSKLDIADRKYNGKEFTRENIMHSYENAYKIIIEERKSSTAFLKKALDIRESDKNEC